MILTWNNLLLLNKLHNKISYGSIDFVLKMPIGMKYRCAKKTWHVHYYLFIFSYYIELHSGSVSRVWEEEARFRLLQWEELLSPNHHQDMSLCWWGLRMVMLRTISNEDTFVKKKLKKCSRILTLLYNLPSIR